jgi:PhnB protein
MESSYRPEGYNSVSPYLVVNGADATIDFLVKVFSAVALRRFPNDVGKLIHAEVRIDDTVVMIADSGDGWQPMPAHVHIYVNDVDAIYQKAIAAGALSIQEPIKKDDEDKRGGVKDSGGTTWWIATKVG